LSSPLSVNRSAIASFLVNKNLPRRPPLLKTNKDSDGPFFFFFFFREARRSSRHPRGGNVFVFATAVVVVVFPTKEEEHALVADERNILFESFFSRLFSSREVVCKEKRSRCLKSNVSHILILERASFLVKPPESSSRMKKRKKNNTNSWLFILSRLFRALFFLSFFS